jgi:hypothetical protein
MGVINSGGSLPTLMGIDPTNTAGRITLRPNEVTGSYRASVVSGTITFSNISGANGILYTFKYTGTGVCLIRSVQVGLQIIATGLTTTGYVPLSLYRVPTSLTQGTTNGTGYGTGQATALTNKKRTSHASPNASIVVYNGTSTGITGDSATNEDAVRYASVVLGAAVSTVTTLPVDGLRDMLQTQDKPYPNMAANYASYPLTLAANEGFRIKNDAAFINGTTGAGTAALVVSVEWDEATAF